MARPYEYAITYAAPQVQSPVETPTPVSTAEYQLITQGQVYPTEYAQPQYEYPQPHPHSAQVSPTDTGPYPVDHAQLVASQQQQQHIQRQMSQVSSHYNTASYEGMRYPTIQTNVNTRKRSFQDDTSPYEQYPGMQQMQYAAELTSPGGHPQLHPSYSYQLASQRGSPTHQQPQHQLYNMPATHHHRMPNQPAAAKYARMSTDEEDHGAPSVVGQPGMPLPAPKPKGPKLKFTSDDDTLLVGLKEEKNLTWKQIADFFPGRSSGTLQVRYCTKLKAKTTVWTDEMVTKLKVAMAEYENDRWRIVASKVGNGFSAQNCQQKSEEMDEAAECDTIVDHDSQAAAVANSETSDGEQSPHSQVRRDTITSFQLNDSGLGFDRKPRLSIPVSGVNVSTPPAVMSAAASYHRDAESFNTSPQHNLSHSVHHSVTPSPTMPYSYTAPPMSARFDVMVGS